MAHNFEILLVRLPWHYAMEYSTNFVNWAYVPGALFIVGNGGTVEVTDAFSGCCGHRFYRARLLPQ